MASNSVNPMNTENISSASVLSHSYPQLANPPAKEDSDIYGRLFSYCHNRIGFAISIIMSILLGASFPGFCVFVAK